MFVLVPVLVLALSLSLVLSLVLVLSLALKSRCSYLSNTRYFPRSSSKFAS